MSKAKREGKYYEVRLYKSHDADLLSLWADGIKVSKILKESMENYVHQKNVKYRISECRTHKLDGSGVIRYHLFLTDPEVIALLARVRKGRRNQFFKNILRGSLLTEPMGGYFLYDQDAEKETKRLQNLEEPEIVELSDYAKQGSGKKQAAGKTGDAGCSSQAKVQTDTQSTKQSVKATENPQIKQTKESRVAQRAEQLQATEDAGAAQQAQDTTEELRPKNERTAAPYTHEEETTKPAADIEQATAQPESPDDRKEMQEEDMLLSLFDNLSEQI